MTTCSIYASKLCPPPLKARMIPRNRIYRKLNAGIQDNRNLTIVCSPAGYGKTTAVAGWLKQMDARGCWLSLDSNDNDPERFIAYLLAGLKMVHNGVVYPVQNMGECCHSQAADAVTGMLINLIEALPPFYLVLDDYHSIYASAVHSIIQSLIHYLPSNLHLIIITREYPDFPLQRRILYGQINEIDMEDLRFSFEEVSDLISMNEEGLIPAKSLIPLYERTEGWVTGIHLALLLFEKNRPAGTKELVSCFEGNNPFFCDYLIHEVLGGQASEIFYFISRTAQLDCFNTVLCSDLLGISNSKEILNRIERKNLFLIPLDDKKEWFRYHRLFSEALQYTLPDVSKTELYKKTSEWYCRNDDIQEAVKYALKSKDFRFACPFIVSACPKMLAQGRLDTVKNWLSSIPHEIMKKYRHLQLIKAWLSAADCNVDEDTFALQLRRPGMESCGKSFLKASILCLKALQSVLKMDPETAEALIGQASSLINENDRFNLINAKLILGHIKMLAGSIPESVSLFREAYALSRKDKNTYLAGIALAFLVRSLHLHGKRMDAVQLCQKYLLDIQQQGGSPTGAWCSIRSLYAFLLLDANQVSQASENIELALTLAADCPISQMEVYDLQAQYLRIRFAAGKLDGMHTLDKPLFSHSVMGDHTGFHGPFDSCTSLYTAQARICIAQNNTEEAGRWIAKLHISPYDTDYYKNMDGYITLANYLLVCGRYQDTLLLLNGMEGWLKATERMRKLLDVLIMKAVLFFKTGRSEMCRGLLSRALEIAAPQGFIRCFLEYDRCIINAIRELHNVHPGFVDRLLDYVADGDTKSVRKYARPSVPAKKNVIPAILSERETEILMCIANGKSNEEMAKELYISKNTVNWHIKNIFLKLKVNNRIKAVTTGKEMGCL